jgi:hypothetical protein
MHSYYVYDEVLELYVLMLIDQDGDEHPIVLEFEEFEQLARWTESGPWIRPTHWLGDRGHPHSTARDHQA